MAPNFKLCLSVCVFILIAESVYSKQLPSFIKPCNRNDPHINKCLIKIVNGLRPRLLKGIPELQLPPYDPLNIPKLSLIQPSTSAVSFNATFTNLKAYGAHKAVVQDIGLDLNKPEIIVKVSFPVVRIMSMYSINGKVLILPISGKGQMSGNFSEVSATVRLLGKYIEKSGKKFIHVETKKVHLELKKSTLYFTNLFNGNKLLGDSTNRFINENWKDILVEIKPVLEETLATLLYDIVKKVFDNFSIDDLFKSS